MPRWITWTLLTLVSWGIWAILSKLIGGSISDAQIQVVSTLGILPILAALFFVPDSPAPGNRRRGVWLAFVSGIISCLGNIAFYAVLSRGAKAAAVIPVTDLYPAVTVLLAVPILKERLNRLQWIGIFLSLGAIYLFHVSQERGLVSQWLLLALVPIVLWGVCGLLQKMSTNDVSGRTSAIWFLLAFIPVAVLIQIFDPLPGNVSARTIVVATAVGFALALGNLTILFAFASGGKASIISPLAGLYPLVSIPIAIAALGEQIGSRETLGILSSLVAVVLLSIQSEPSESAGTALDTDTSL
jgi:drug/metabolite transporter (DMT)-like permease